MKRIRLTTHQAVLKRLLKKPGFRQGYTRELKVLLRNLKAKQHDKALVEDYSNARIEEFLKEDRLDVRRTRNARKRRGSY